MTVHTVSPRINLHALMSENRMFWGYFEIILCSNINACTFFRKLSAAPGIFRDFVTHYDTLNNSSVCVFKDSAL